MGEVTASIGKMVEVEIIEVLEDGRVLLFCNRWEPQLQFAEPGDRIIVFGPRNSGIVRAEELVEA